jgi:AAA ATPase-like protein
MIRLGEILSEVRSRAFVGRERELALFREGLAGGPSAFSVLFVHGPGGIGKSALLHQYATEAARAGRSVVRVDCREVEPTPTGFEAASARALTEARPVLLIDGFERCQGLGGWIRRDLLPRLPDDVLVVVAGQLPPSPQWRADPSLVGLLKVLALTGLSTEEAVDLLDHRGVKPALHDPLLRFAGGHPLALCLAAQVAAQDVEGVQAWAPAGDVIGALLAPLLADLPSAAHRHALEVCAHALATTEDLLRSVVSGEAGTLFDWLRRQPFIESGEQGLVPHDVVRDALDTDLRWRDPQGYEEMHQRIRRYLVAQARQARGAQALQVAAALAYLHRAAGLLPQFITWKGQGEVYSDILRPRDATEVRRLTLQAEGPASTAVVDFWLERRPEAFTVYRRSDTQEVVAFLAWLRLSEPVELERATDPIVDRVWAHTLADGPLRQGEHVGIARFLIDPGCYQRPSPVMDQMQFRIASEFHHGQHLAWTFIVFADGNFWRPLADYLHMAPLATPVIVGERPCTVFTHDWRKLPLEAWQDLVRSRTAKAWHPDRATVPAVVLPDRSEFSRGVRDALRGMSYPRQFDSNPLLRSHLVRSRDGDPVEVLQKLLTEAVGALADDPREARFGRAVAQAYLFGDLTQDRAAAKLCVSLSTYKRHLATGIERVCDELWERELQSRAESE